MPRPIGADTNFVLKLFRKPEGFFFLLALIVEGMLFLIFIVGRTETERLLAIAGFLFILFMLIVFFSWERHRVFKLDMQRLQPRAVPESMTAAPIKAEDADRASDLMTAGDGTFVYGVPPANWRVQQSSVEEQAKVVISLQSMEEMAVGTEQRFRAGPIVLFTEATVHHIAYIPGKSLLNGRPAMGVLNEDLCDQVVMLSVSKRGGIVRDMPAQHVFAYNLSSLVNGGLKINSIRFAPSEVNGRATLTARGTLGIQHALVDGIEMASVTLECRLHVVEYANFVYVIRTNLLDGMPTSGARRDEIDQIVQSFRAASAANAVEREKADEVEADKYFVEMMKESADAILTMKGRSLIRQMSGPNGLPRVTDKQLEAVKMLESYAIAFPDYVSEEEREALKELVECTQEAVDGQPARLAALIESVVSDETEPQLPASTDP